MPPTETTLLTVKEFEKIPDPPGGHYELHHGELILVPPPKKGHANAQTRIMLILKRICIGWFVTMEFAFRPLPEYEVWEADVGMVTQQRWDETDDGSWLEGAPDLVVEVLSPSNTQMEINDRERICFQGGCREFWVVDPKLQTIRVSTPDGAAHTHNIGDDISLDRFTPGSLAVAEVFAD